METSPAHLFPIYRVHRGLEWGALWGLLGLLVSGATAEEFSPNDPYFYF